MKTRHSLALTLAMMGLAACTPTPTTTPTPPTTHHATHHSATPTPHAPTTTPPRTPALTPPPTTPIGPVAGSESNPQPVFTRSRCIEASTIAKGLTTPQRNAAWFTILAGSADALNDPTPPDAWKNASSMTTPRLAHELQTQRRLATSPWWKSMKAHHGCIGIHVTNVLGGAPQEPGDTTYDKPTQDMVVMFTRSYHTDHGRTNDLQLHQWTLHWVNARVDEFEPDSTD